MLLYKWKQVNCFLSLSLFSLIQILGAKLLYFFTHPAFLFQRGCGPLGASTDETYFRAFRISTHFHADHPFTRTSGEKYFRFHLKLKITSGESTYPSQRPQSPSLSPHFLLVCEVGLIQFEEFVLVAAPIALHKVSLSWSNESLNLQNHELPDLTHMTWKALQSHLQRAVTRQSIPFDN